MPTEQNDSEMKISLRMFPLSKSLLHHESEKVSVLTASSSNPVRPTFLDLKVRCPS